MISEDVLFWGANGDNKIFSMVVGSHGLKEASILISKLDPSDCVPLPPIDPFSFQEICKVSFSQRSQYTFKGGETSLLLKTIEEEENPVAIVNELAKV